MLPQEKVKHLLSHPTIDSIDSIRSLINELDQAYYVRSEKLISDFEYDQLFALLKKLEQEHPETITPDSPTQRVAKVLAEGFQTVKHSVPMLSLDNSYNADDLLDFDTSVKKLSGKESVSFFAEPKFDGASIALLYENDLFVRGATRGNGEEGEDITHNAKMIRSVPLKAAFSKYGIHKIELRGEVVIESNAFNKMNEEREAQGLQIYNNPRNTASGSLRIKDSGEVKKRNLEAFIYQIGYCVDIHGNNLLTSTLESQEKNIKLLETLGFKVPTHEAKKCNNIQEVIQFCNEWEEKRDRYNYEIDGMVIKVNNLQTQMEIGFTSHHPKWAIAYKFKPRQASSQLLDVEYQIGRTGVITPVAKIDPVRLAGVTISSISLHNEDFIKEKDIQLHDYVVVERAGDVIPYISSVDLTKRHHTKKIQFPDNCPECHHPISKQEGEAAYRCLNYNCQAQVEERLIHFVSKDAMDIKGFGREIIISFLKEKIIHDIVSIYTIDFDKVAQLEGWKQKSIQNLKEGIEQSKHQPLNRLLVGLGIRQVGSTTAKMLVKQVSHIKDFYSFSEEDFMQLQDIGPKAAKSLYEFFQDSENRSIIDELEQLGINLKQENAPVIEGVLSGKIFVFTGFRDENLEKQIESLGGTIGNSLSKKTNYLVMKEKGSGSSKEKKALEYGTEILDVNDLNSLLNK